MKPIDIDKAYKAFLEYSLSPGIEYILNDSVEITDGEYKGLRGAVISIRSVNPEVIFIVELSNGRDVDVPQQLLKVIKE